MRLQLLRTFLGEREWDEKESVWHEMQTALCSSISWEVRKSANSAVIEIPSTDWPWYLCLAWKSWQIPQPRTTLQRRPGLFIPWMDFRDTYMLTAWVIIIIFSVTFILMWINLWTMHKHFEWTQTMAQLRSDCSVQAAKWPIVADSLLPRNQTDGSVSLGIL